MQLDKKKILVVDDDQKLLDLVLKYLNKEGYIAHGVADAQEMDAYLSVNNTELVILDLMLPGEDGLSIARRLRSNSDIPILMLSARGEEIDRIIGFEVGADDYLPKPFNPRELLARIKAILRRTNASQAKHSTEQLAAENYKFGAFELNLTTNTLYHKDFSTVH